MAKRKRTFKNPKTRVKLVRNQSDRAPGSTVQALAVHSTESHPRPGVQDLEGLWSWFNSPVSQASSHYGLDDSGEAWQFVSGKRKAWTIGAANSWTINYELIGFAAWTPSRWKAQMKQLKKLAQLLAYHSRQYDIPLRRGAVGNRGGVCVCTKRGVITHHDVTRAGFGSHTDPGAGFPLWLTIRMARWYKRHGWFAGTPTV